MAKLASYDVEVIYDGDDMTPYVQTINGINVKDAMHDSQSFGERWNAMSPTGSKDIEPIVFGGLYDDDNDGPQAKWDVTTLNQTPGDATHTLVIRLGAGSPDKTYTIPVHPSAFNIKLERNKVHEYEATLVKGRGDVTKT